MRRLSPNRLIVIVVILVALISGLLMLSQGASTSDGQRTLALDDSYIHLQYAWQAAQGHFLQYNTGDAPTTGATSLLYMLLVAAGFWLGISKDAMPPALLIAGLALFMLAAALLADLARRAADALIDRRPFAARPEPVFPPWSAGLVAGFVFATSGWIAWVFLSGMETGLLIALVIAALWAFQTDHVRLMALLAALAALTRPEAALLGGMLLVAQIIRDPGEFNDRRRRALWACLPLAAVLVVPAISLLLTGTLAASGLQAKSWFTVVPLYLNDVVAAVAMAALMLLFPLFGGPALDGRWHAFPLAVAFALIGMLLLWRRGRVREKRLALICLGWWGIGTVATATLQTAAWHHYRYQTPFYPALILPLAITLTALVGDLARTLQQRTGSRLTVRLVGLIGLAALAFWAVYTLSDFGAAYALDTNTTARQQIVLATWIRENTPEDSLLAVHDVGAIRFFGGRDTLDVVGLTTAGMALVGGNGPGAIYEALETARPDYYVVYPIRTLPYHGIEDAPALLGPEVFRAEINPWSPYTSADSVQTVNRPDWSGVPLTESPQQPHLLEQLAGWTPVDRLDVADMDSERAHSYSWWHEGQPRGFLTEPRVMAYHDAPGLTLADGLRTVTGGMSFVLRTPEPGQWTRLVARGHQTGPITLRVRVNGADAGLWRIPALPGEWLESAFLIRPDLIPGTETAIELSVVEPAEDRRYSVAQLWAYQGQPEVLPPAPGAISGASFGDVARLAGFDLPGRVFAPGDIVPLTLHWEALTPYMADLRVFVHLIDPANDTAAGILAQADGVPRGGTYPFWVWQEGEFVRDEVALTLPADAAPGEYLLLVGIYDGQTGERLPIVGGDDLGSSRLILGPITVRAGG